MQTKTIAKSEQKHHKYSDDEKQIHAERQIQIPETDIFRQERCRQRSRTRQNQAGRAKPKHVVDAEILHITTKDIVGLVKTITSPSTSPSPTPTPIQNQSSRQ
ncbi:hypothetical protein Tco_0256227 [Tanacetum coccineum]